MDDSPTASTLGLEIGDGGTMLETSSSPELSAKPRRGRPRLENARDETAQDRRRAQIRVAQRNYRKKKDQAANELRERVQELEARLYAVQQDLAAVHDHLMSFTIRNPTSAVSLAGAIDLLANWEHTKSPPLMPHTRHTHSQPPPRPHTSMAASSSNSTSHHHVHRSAYNPRASPYQEHHAHFPIDERSRVSPVGFPPSSSQSDFTPSFSQLPQELPIPEAIKNRNPDEGFSLAQQLKWRCMMYNYKVIMTPHPEECKRIFGDDHPLNLYSLALTMLNKDSNGTWIPWLEGSLDAEHLPRNMMSAEMVENLIRQSYMIFDDSLLIRDLAPKNVFLGTYPAFSRDDVNRAIAIAVHQVILPTQIM